MRFLHKLHTIGLSGAIAIVALWLGIGGLSVRCEGNRPQALTCAEATRAEQPRAWLELTGCRLEVTEADVETRPDGRLSRALIPLTPAEHTPGGPYRILLLTREAALLDLLQRYIERVKATHHSGVNLELREQDPAYRRFLERQGARHPANALAQARDDLEAFLAEHGAELAPVRNVRGLVLSGLQDSSSVIRRINLLADVPSDRLVIEHDAEPGLIRWLVLTVIGLIAGLAALGGLAGLLLVASRRQASRDR
jgi:hypothetical protein